MALTQVSTGGIKDGQVHTADLADAQITAGKLHADALDHTYTLGADGSNHYTFTGEGLTGAVDDPTLYLTRGKTYRFVNGNSAGAHPFRIQTTVNGSAGTEYNTGVTNNGGAGGSTIIFEVPHAAPDVLYYQCTSHGSMGGIFYVTGALADGTVTTAKLADDAVTTAKIANDAVTYHKISDANITTDKIANSNVTSAKIAADAITTAKIADDAVTDAKLANSINSAIAANTAKDLTALSASNLTSGTVPDARFPATLPAVSGANLTNLPAGGQATNLLINGQFNVWQRGTDSGSNTSDLYVADRWYAAASGATKQVTRQAFTLGQTDVPSNPKYYLRYAVTTGNNNAALRQRIEDVTRVQGQVTLSFWVKGSNPAGGHFDVINRQHFGTGGSASSVVDTGVGSTFTVTNSWAKKTFTFTPPSISGKTLGTNNDSYYELEVFRQPAGDTGTAAYTIDIANVQLEKGGEATDYAVESYDDTLQKCKRYCHVIASKDYSYLGLGMQYYSGTIFIDGGKIDMRDTPTMVAKSGVSGAYVYEKVFGNSAEYIHQISLDGKTTKDHVFFNMAGTASRYGEAVRCACHAFTLQNGEPFVYLESEL